MLHRRERQACARRRRRRERDVRGDAIEPRAASTRPRARDRASRPAACTATTRVFHAMRPSSAVPRSRRLAQRLRRRGLGERALRDQHRAAVSSAADALSSAPENRRNSAVATSARITKATSTSSSEKPRARRVRAPSRAIGRRARRAHAVASIEDRDAAGEPVDVDFVLALARRRRVMRPPLLPPSGKKRIEPTFSSTRSLCAVKSLSSTLARQRVLVRVARRPGSVRCSRSSTTQRLAPLRERLAAREAQPRRELARRALQLGGRHAAAEHRHDERRDDRHDRQHDQQLEQRHAARAPRGARRGGSRAARRRVIAASS